MCLVRYGTTTEGAGKGRHTAITFNTLRTWRDVWHPPCITKSIQDRAETSPANVNTAKGRSVSHLFLSASVWGSMSPWRARITDTKNAIADEGVTVHNRSNEGVPEDLLVSQMDK